jgi:hypothetical protein
MYSTPGQRVFVRLSEGILRRFRFKLDDLWWLPGALMKMVMD